MADQLRVTLVQEASDLDPRTNRERLADLVPAGSDLVVLPEAFARDFGKPGSDVSGHAEPLDGPFARELARVAEERGTTVVAGMFRTGEDPDRPFNTLLVRGAVEASYDKIHLYDSFGYRESDRLSAGPWQVVVVEVGGFRVGLMTCYDLRFPELARALVLAGAEVLVVPAAWVAGERKVDHWLTLLRARAIENTVHVVGVGQPAPRYTGHSAAFSPLGDELVQTGPEAATVEVVLTREELETARRINPSLANRRG
ncbi:carbon-nitrogen hydrolase family protein [Nocardioides solisilvae]|uniref:carbon-nitrogen hydrolase family protein n=1 Tax=Nocardioides solisilvae TaxID=1542435 RepID=UPI000D748A86|nr:carbon-nitrogen hydrolase family protein [Nocardioides solisilvae]